MFKSGLKKLVQTTVMVSAILVGAILPLIKTAAETDKKYGFRFFREPVFCGNITGISDR